MEQSSSKFSRPQPGVPASSSAPILTRCPYDNYNRTFRNCLPGNWVITPPSSLSNRAARTSDDVKPEFSTKSSTYLASSMLQSEVGSPSTTSSQPVIHLAPGSISGSVRSWNSGLPARRAERLAAKLHGQPGGGQRPRILRACRDHNPERDAHRDTAGAALLGLHENRRASDLRRVDLYRSSRPFPGPARLKSPDCARPDPSRSAEPFDSCGGSGDARRPRKSCDGLEAQCFRAHTGPRQGIDLAEPARIPRFVTKEQDIHRFKGGGWL
jgi:hypothetical protein